MAYIDETGSYKSAADWNTGTGGTGGTLPVVPGDPALNPYFPPQNGAAERYMIHDGKLYVAAIRGSALGFDGHGTPKSSGDTDSDSYKGVDNWVEWSYPVGSPDVSPNTGEPTPPQSEDTRVHDGWFTETGRYVLFDDGNLWGWGTTSHGDLAQGVNTYATNNPVLIDKDVYSIAVLPEINNDDLTQAIGICSDYIKNYKE